MNNFTPYAGAIGGLLIGLSVTFMMLFVGRITGISGIYGGVVVPRGGEIAWRVIFVLGLITGGVILKFAYPQAFPTINVHPSMIVVAVAGLLVGYGTRLGSGCTSGHGICGLARFSQRSFVSVLTFMFTGAVAVYVMRHVIGGF
ncbi:MAG: YeeE/YedE family protein [Deltaproteobacteria bacterium]|nr:MAG: YeeE/YedE family protein [Deltaproteobacteria bacterium]